MSRKCKAQRLFTLSLAIFLSIHGISAAMAAVTAFVGGNVVDVEDGSILDDAVLLTDDGKIIEIGPRSETKVPEGAKIVDVTGKWLTPGLMNMHVHFDLKLPGKMSMDLLYETVPEMTLRAARTAEAALLSGTTTVRSTGDTYHTSIAIGKAADRGEILAPRIFSSGKPVSPTGGHGLKPNQLGVDGADDVRAAVRKELRDGATWIKLMISRGIASFSGDIAAGDLTFDEMKAAVEIAHRRGFKVTAHSGSPVATLEALEAGVDCFEHGYFLTEDVFRKMKKAGAWYVPTIVVSQPGSQEFFEKIGSPQWYLDRRKVVGVAHWEALKTAIRTGVNIAMGSDQHPSEPNSGTVASIRELELYQKAGMTPLEALQAGTLQTSRLLEIQDEVGTLSEGKAADIIVMSKNPTEDISALRTIGIVVKGGEVVRNDWAE